MRKQVKVKILGVNFIFLLMLFCIISLTISAKTKLSVQFLKEKPQYFVFSNNETNLIVNKKTWKLSLIDSKDNHAYSEFEMPVFLVDDQWISAKQLSDVNVLSDQSVELSIKTSNSLLLKLSVRKAGATGFRLKYNIPEAHLKNIKGTIKLNTVEEIYGFGENWNGHVAQRGQIIEVWDKAGTPDECAWMPYYVSTNNYAFFINHGGLVKFDIGQSKSDELRYELASGELEYTILSGKSVVSATQNFIALTGMPTKPPRWSFKPWFWLSNNPDFPNDNRPVKGEHVLKMAEKLKELNIPIGVTWFEPFWQEERTNFIPSKSFSPDIKKLIADLDKLDIKTLAWTVPYTLPEASNWKEAVKNEYLVKKPGNTVDANKTKISSSGELEGTYYNSIDFFNPEAFKWWQSQIEQAIDLGLKGFKLDAGQELPYDGILHGGRIGKDVNNSYALEYNRVYYESLKKKLGDDFIMVPRAAWIGSAAKTNFKWPGDLSGSFANNGLPSSVHSSLSLAFSGITFVSTDIGGFMDQPAPEDVWLRWAQFGAFLPGMQTLHMPWWYSVQAQEHFRYLAWLHTDLIPYWETLARLANKTGTPICKHLVFDYQDDINTWRIDNEFTVGEYILVAPILNSERNREVYLPEGRWFNFWNDSIVYTGKQKIRSNFSREEAKTKFPLYIKEGAIIPMEVENEISGFGSKYSDNFVTLAIWPKMNAQSEFILNDRESEMPITANWSEKNELNIEWKNSTKDYLLRIHWQATKLPENVVINNSNVKQNANLDEFNTSKTNGWFYDKQKLKLWIKKMNDGHNCNIKIN